MSLFPVKTIILENCQNQIEVKEMIVWSRWGQIVFKNQSIDFSWDGYFNNKIMSADNYIYRILAVNRNGKELVYTGDVTLIR